MATGSFLAAALAKRGGKPNEYADVVVGKVLNTEPLKIQLDAKTILTAEFLTLSKHVTEYQIKINGELVTVDESLQTGDEVFMIRKDGGQHFFILERAGTANG
jgi:hypothetical protein